ncbi:hypothetical protein [Rhodanobacter sp. BL-MT-08]
MIRNHAQCASLLVGLIAGIVALPAMAQPQTAPSQPPPSLGQSWPQMANVSAAPGWRVYAFVRDKVKYIQVNDLVGTVRATLATADGYFLVLPLGADAQRVSTPTKPLAAALDSSAPAVTVYQDKDVQLTARYQSDGSTVWTAIAKTSPKATTTHAAPPATPLDCPPCGASGQ